MSDVDATLCLKAQTGCRDSFRQLVERHQRGLFGLLRRRVSNPADIDDVAQDVFLRAWRSIGSYSPRWPFRTWLYSIAVRASIDLTRRYTLPNTDVAIAQAQASQCSSPYEETARRDQARALWALAGEVLPAAQRTALWLRYAEDCEPHQIGKMLDRSATAVRLLLMRARRRLRHALTRGIATDPSSKTRPTPPPTGVCDASK